VVNTWCVTGSQTFAGAERLQGQVVKNDGGRERMLVPELMLELIGRRVGDHVVRQVGRHQRHPRSGVPAFQAGVASLVAPQRRERRDHRQ
jgi:hypothetical protein